MPRTGVCGLPRPFEHAVVGDLVKKVVRKREFTGVNIVGRVAAHDQLLAKQRGQRVDGVRVDRSQSSVPELMPDDRSLLQCQTLGRCQSVQTRLQHAEERRRNMCGKEFVG